MVKDHYIYTDIYDCAINPSRWEPILDRSVKQTGASAGIMGVIPQSSSDAHWSLNIISELWRNIPESQASFMRQQFYEYEKEAWQALANLRPLEYLPDNEAYPLSSNIDQREDYVYLKENVGILRKVAIRLNADPASFDTIMFQFDKSLQRIPKASELRIKEICPHFAKSIELSRTFKTLKHHYQAALTALNHVNVGLCVLNDRHQIIVSNEEAHRIAEETAYISMKDDSLKCFNRDATATLQQQIAQASIRGGVLMQPSEQVLILKRPGHAPAFIHATHLRDSSAELGHELEGVLVSIVDLSKADEYNVSAFAAAYAFTDSETRVCELLSIGLSNKEIADQRDVSPDTVKTQVKSIYAKAGISNRVDLVKSIVKTFPPIR